MLVGGSSSTIDCSSANSSSSSMSALPFCANSAITLPRSSVARVLCVVYRTLRILEQLLLCLHALAACRQCRCHLFLHLGLCHQVDLLLHRQQSGLIRFKLLLGGLGALEHAHGRRLLVRLHEPLASSRSASALLSSCLMRDSMLAAASPAWREDRPSSYQRALLGSRCPSRRPCYSRSRWLQPAQPFVDARSSAGRCGRCHTQGLHLRLRD